MCYRFRYTKYIILLTRLLCYIVVTISSYIFYTVGRCSCINETSSLWINTCLFYYTDYNLSCLIQFDFLLPYTFIALTHKTPSRPRGTEVPVRENAFEGENHNKSNNNANK